MFDALLWKQFITQFHFMRPAWLIVFIPFAVILYLRWKREENESWQTLLPKHLKSALTVGESGWKKQRPLIVLSLIISVTIVVCAGPTWQKEASPFGEDKAPLIIVLDVSKSMLQTDLLPTRLTRAKQKISDLLELRNGGKTGLIVYSGSAHLAMPLTQDTKVFKPILSAIDPTIMPVEGKMSSAALPLVQRQMKSENVIGSVLLITDKVLENDINKYEEFFREQPHQLLILATGDNSKRADLPMDYSSLQSLARHSNGVITTPSVDRSDVEWLNDRIERHMQLSNDSALPWKDMGYYLVFPLALIILFWFRKGWLVQWSLLLLVASSSLYSPSSYAELVSVTSNAASISEEKSFWDKSKAIWLDLWLTPDQQGQWYFEHQQYLEAAYHYQDPIKKGVAFYYASEFQSAHTLFLQAGTEQGRFYASNALIGMREYVAARKVLFDIVESNPEFTEAQHNLEIVEAVIQQINEFSQSQAESMEGSQESSQELPSDKPQTADGAKEQVASELVKKETLTAEEILQNSEIADKWLKRVEADPKNFLRVKFMMQQQAGDNT